MFLWKRYQRTVKTRRKGKAVDEVESEDGQPTAKATEVKEWVAKAVRRTSKKDLNESTPNLGGFANQSSVTLNGSAPITIKSSKKDSYKPLFAKSTPNLSSQLTLSSLPNVPASKSHVNASAIAASLGATRSYNGPPPRFTGGSSKWTAPSEKGVLCRAVFGHRPDEFDEMLMKRGDYVVIDMYFEDGWTLVHIIEPSKYRFPKKTKPATISTTNGFAARWRPTRSSAKHASAGAAIGKGKAPAAASRADVLSPEASAELSELHASLDQPRDQTTSGMVPWHCLHEIPEEDVRAMQKQLAEAELITMTHAQMAARFGYSSGYR
ncbi:hypothetical protein HKX48_002762 [Thoreauomyces humboldtii]|nr:hypothetical protein HKX48_002762 [Thoreauomyces humboldtii]